MGGNKLSMGEGVYSWGGGVRFWVGLGWVAVRSSYSREPTWRKVVDKLSSPSKWDGSWGRRRGDILMFVWEISISVDILDTSGGRPKLILSCPRWTSRMSTHIQEVYSWWISILGIKIPILDGHSYPNQKSQMNMRSQMDVYILYGHIHPKYTLHESVGFLLFCSCYICVG